MIRVFLIADSPFARAGLQTILVDAGAEIVGHVPTLTAVDDEAIAGTEPDIALVDATREFGEAQRSAIAEIASYTKVVLLVDDAHGIQLGSAVSLGVHAILPREIPAAQLQVALQAVSAGLFGAHPSELSVSLPVRSLTSAGANSFVEQLTKREREVLQMLAAGLGNKEIASRLSLSEHTAKFHVASILGKLGAASRTEAVAIGIRHGLVLL